MSVPSFGAWLRASRRKYDLTQHHLAHHAGCSVVTIRKLEAGERKPSRQIALRLAETLHIPPDDRGSFVAFARGELDAATALAVLTPGAEQPIPPTQPLGRLPTALTPLIGRDDDLGEAHSLLLRPGERLLNLVGPAGIGKTRLALALAETTRRHFADGAAFVALDHVREPDHVLTTIAVELGLSETGNQHPLQQLITALHRRRMLLVLDTMEHLLPAGPLLIELLSALPTLHMLVTSRAALKVRGERLYHVTPLRLTPQTNSDVVSPAAALFLDRARATWPDFTLSPAQIPMLDAICGMVDGLPLAIELVAGWTAMLSLAQIRARLDRHLQIVAGGSSDLPMRHRSLHGALSWSYTLLPVEAQRIFRHLGVFAGGFTIEAATTVLGEEAADDLLTQLELLRQHSLLTVVSGPDGTPRMHILATVRAYGCELLAQHNELAVASRRHASHFAAYAERHKIDLTGPAQLGALQALAIEGDNLTAALQWSFGSTGDPAIGFGLVQALGWFWWLQSRYSEGLHWIERALACTAAPEIRAQLLSAGAYLAVGVSKREQRLTLAQDGLRLLQHLGDRAGSVRLLALLAEQTSGSEYEAEAAQYGEAAVAAAGSESDPWLQALALQSLALNKSGAAAVELLDAARRLADRSGDRWLRGVILFRRQLLHMDQGRPEEVLRELAELDTLAAEFGDRRMATAVLLVRARVATVGNNRACADTLHRQALAVAQSGGLTEMAAWTQVLHGLCLIEFQDYAAARQQIVVGLHTGEAIDAPEVLLRGMIALAGLAAGVGQADVAAALAVLAEELWRRGVWPLAIRESAPVAELAKLQPLLDPGQVAVMRARYAGADRQRIRAALRSLIEQ